MYNKIDKVAEMIESPPYSQVRSCVFSCIDGAVKQDAWHYVVANTHNATFSVRASVYESIREYEY
jgi:hypothetical protein